MSKYEFLVIVLCIVCIFFPLAMAVFFYVVELTNETERERKDREIFKQAKLKALKDLDYKS